MKTSAFVFMFYIYFLYSPSSDIYYTGYSNDYNQRFIQHNTTDRDTFTSKHRPWLLAGVFEASKSEAEAIRIERFIKKQKSRRLVEKILSGEPLVGILAKLVRVPHLRD